MGRYSRPRAPMTFYAIQSIRNSRMFLPFISRTTRIGKLRATHITKHPPRLWKTKSGATRALRFWEQGFWKMDWKTRTPYLKQARKPGEVGSMQVVQLEVRQMWP